MSALDIHSASFNSTLCLSTSSTTGPQCTKAVARATRPRVQPPPLVQAHQPFPSVQPEMLDAAAVLLGPLTDLEGSVREGGAAFGRLDVLARRKSARVFIVKQNQPCSTSLPRQPCSSPGAGWLTSSASGYSRQWLLTHRGHCGGSPLRPSHQEPRSAPAAAPAPEPAPEARTGLTLTTGGTRAGSKGAAARSEGAAGAAKPPPKMKQVLLMEPKMEPKAEHLAEQAHLMG